MKYVVAARSDIGNVKATNQDSIAVIQAETKCGNAVMAIVCDGMGGLSKGEVASSSVIKRFESWFKNDLKYELVHPDINVIAERWVLMLKELNEKIIAYGNAHGVSLGTTFTGMFILNENYIAVHVGDTRLYTISPVFRQLTDDHSVVGEKIRRGEITPEQAERDKQRNVLTQCIGASPRIAPQVLRGHIEKGTYMICSDGFRHKISEGEIAQAFDFTDFDDSDKICLKEAQMINLVKERRERDNISVVIIRAKA